jgi:S1-C subfamily serine protease
MWLRGCRPMRRLSICIAVVILTVARAQMPVVPVESASARKTPWVDLIRKVEPGVVAIVRQDAAGKVLTSSGSIIHEAGFVLTSDRAVQGQPGYAVIKGLAPMPYRVVGRLMEKDLALIQVAADRALPLIPLGRSLNLAAGEPILTAGNPGARGVVFSSGMIGSAGIVVSAPDPWAAATYSQTACDRYIQLDTPANPGNAGGPVLDANGLQIAVVTGKKLTEDNANLAVPVDRVRACFRTLASPEERADIWAGVDVDVMAPSAVITAVEPNGPGARAGLRVGDQIVSLYGRPARDGLSWILALVGRKAGEAMVVTYSRAGKQQQVTLTLESYPVFEPADGQDLSDGLRYAAYRGRFTAMPDFSKLDPANMGTSPAPRATGLEGAGDAHFALAFIGYVEIPESGVYRVVLGSDGGSRLFLDGLLTADNNGLHPYQEASSVCRLLAGLHPVRIDYFEAVGDPELNLRIEPDNPSSPQAPIALQFYCE